MAKSKQHNSKLIVTIPYCTARDGYQEEKTEIIDIFNYSCECEGEEIVSNKDKKKSLKIAKKLEETLSPSTINELNILLTSLYCIALEDGFNRY